MRSYQENIYTSVPRVRRESSAIASSRRELLDELSCGIQADEASARSLLQAFDIDGDALPDKPAHLARQGSLRPLSNTLGSTSEANIPSKPVAVAAAMLPPSHSENILLDTPLRFLRGFPSLSLSTHHYLLRSPSTPDGSFETGNDQNSALPSTLSLEFPASAKSNESQASAYLLTPPLTARIPYTESHETPSSMLHSPLDFEVAKTHGFHTEGIDYTDSVPDIKACLSSMTPFTATGQKKPQRTPFSFATAADSEADPTVGASQSFSLLSSVHSRSQFVTDGRKARGETAEDLRAYLMSTPLDPELSRTYVATAADVPSTPATPSRRPRNLGRGAKNGRSRKPGRILRREFAELLEARAIEEEKHAQELLMMASRLERLASQRKQLAAAIIEDIKS